MKFGKELASQMVQEWQEAYMDYNYLKTHLKNILQFRQKNKSSPVAAATSQHSLKRRLSLYRAYSGLTSTLYKLSPGKKKEESPKEKEDEVILVSALQQEGSEGCYRTMFLMSSDEGGEYELVFFRRLDDEFNKVLEFYKSKVEEVLKEAKELNKQMDALIALRIKVENPVAQFGGASMMNLATNGVASSAAPASHSINGRNPGGLQLDVIQEVEMSNEGHSEDAMRGDNLQKTGNHRKADEGKMGIKGFRPASLEILNHVKINVTAETPKSTLKGILLSSKPDLLFSKEELRKAEELMKQAFIEFYQELHLLKGYSFLNQLAFSKIMKKYDKITSRSASKAYLKMVDNSYLGSCVEVTTLIERVEATFVKHFSNGNRRKGMSTLRPKAKREKHRITFFLGFFSGCSIALVVAIVMLIHVRNILHSEGRDQYMETIFPLYSLFGFVVLHMLIYSANIYFWRRYRVNYPFIFGFKQGTELGYREVFLLSSGLAVLTLAGVISNLNMQMDPQTKSFRELTELVPLGLVLAVLLITVCPLNIIYRSSRFFLIKSAFHCICAPLYKVTLPDFFLADQLTIQRSFHIGLAYFKIENEHLNNVGKFRAFKSVPLPFNYDDEDKDV
ncbi:hypothetical protein L1049_003008 [Liquidambar formosana]|uniref:SPX domain-containing protein n=1 Tax=Liquidambar formosana TaxID=63359 RepID=A0AAP0NIP8_LIQFO